MKLSYFPGCTLKTKAKGLDREAVKCAEILGVTLEEIYEWQCCGGVFTTSKDEIATKLSSVRALKYAKDKGQALITVCSACHNVIKQTNHQMQDEEFRNKVNNYLGDGYDGSTKVYHYLEMLRDLVGFDKIKEKVVNPLKGQKIACYYGCLLLRPNSVMQMDDPENPSIMEDFILALGATPVYYAFRNECCGAYATIESESLSKRSSNRVVDSAKLAGAEKLVTACPLCKYNLEKNTSGLPIIYFTSLLAMALGVKENIND